MTNLNFIFYLVFSFVHLYFLFFISFKRTEVLVEFFFVPTMHKLRASACYVGKEREGACALFVQKKKTRHVYQPPVDPENPSGSTSY